MGAACLNKQGEHLVFGFPGTSYSMNSLKYVYGNDCVGDQQKSIHIYPHPHMEIFSFELVVYVLYVSSHIFDA